MKYTIRLLFLSILFTQCSSKSDYDHISNDQVKSILQNGISAAGGLDNWKNGKAYSFDKETFLYHEDNSIEVHNNQIVTIKNHPSLEGTIQWNNPSDTVDTKIVYSDRKAIKYINDQPQEDAANEAAQLSFLGSHMVMNLPFKLLDPGVHLTYGGQMTLFNKTVEVLVADYNKDQPNHNKTHRWWHYFDAESFEYIGYKVFHPPTYALVENRASTTHNGITYNTDRITWRVDTLNQKQFIRARFNYTRFRDAD